MAFFQGAASSGLAAAFRQFRASGVPREALEQALSEVYQDQPPTSAAQPESAYLVNPFDEAESQAKYGHQGRLSVSTTSSKSSDQSRASVLSTATSISSVSSQPVGDKTHRVTGPSRPSSSQTTKSTTSPRYWCTSCETTFARKYDWKRHEEEFHERYRRYPCPGCNRVFWGANTFNQHHKAAHNCTTCPHAHDVVVYTKRKCAWGCGICAAFLPSRDRFFDHVSKHFELGMTKTEHWTHSRVIYGLLHQPQVYQAWKELVAMLWGDNQPSFSWNPETTGRSPGFLENGSPGKLQDFLEFFSEKSFDVRQLVQLAHDQADIIPRYPEPVQFAQTNPMALPAGSMDTASQDPTSPTTPMSAPMPAPMPAPQQPMPVPQQPQQMMQMVVGGPQLGQQAPSHDFGDSGVPSMQVASPQYMTPLRFTDTIMEVPELEYYDLGPSNHHLGPSMPHAATDEWSSMPGRVVEQPLWGEDPSYSHHGPAQHGLGN